MNPSNNDTDRSENSDPFNCDILPSSSNEDESASIKYLKRHPDPSLSPGMAHLFIILRGHSIMHALGLRITIE
jgi:hypothetical protein